VSKAWWGRCGIEAGLLLQHVRRGRFGRFFFQRKMHPLMATVLLRVAGLDAFNLDAQAEPPHREFAQAVERVRGREGHAVIRANGLRQSEFLEGPLEDGEGEFLLGGRQRLARQQVPTGEVGDRQGIAVLAIAEQKLAFVVGTPERIRLGRARELGPRRTWPPTAAVAYEIVAIEHRVDRANGRQVWAGELLPQLFADLGRPPARIFSLQAHDRRFNRRR